MYLIISNRSATYSTGNNSGVANYNINIKTATYWTFIQIHDLHTL